MNKTKRYDPETKQKIVELYRSGMPVSEIEITYEVSNVSIYRWIKELSPVKTSMALSPDEIIEIQKENLKLREEIEILKKAMSIMSRK